MHYRKALTTGKEKSTCLMSLTSEKLLLLKKEFDSLVAHADFDPTSFNGQLQNSTFASSTSKSPVCIPVLQPNPSLQGRFSFTAPKSDEEVTVARAAAVPKSNQRTTNWALNIWKQWTSYQASMPSSRLSSLVPVH